MAIVAAKRAVKPLVEEGHDGELTELIAIVGSDE